MRANARSILASTALSTLAALASFSVQAQNQDINPRVDTSKPAVDDVNPRVDTSVAPPADAAPLPAPAKGAAPKPSSATSAPKPATAAGSTSGAPNPAAANNASRTAAPNGASSTPAPNAASTSAPGSGSPTASPGNAAAPAAAKKGGKSLDRLELDTTQITGNRELPKVLYIVPWKRADLGDLVGRPVNSLLDEVLTPVDRDVFQRENRYYRALTPANGAAPADPNGAPQSKSGGNTIPVTGVGPASSGSGDASATPSPGNER